MNARITLLPAFEKREELIPLYQEYADMLVRVEPIFTRSLEQQNYDEEIARLEEKYAPPRGSIYLVYVDDELAGCVGMKPSDAESAELKRLYVRPAFRGQNLGELMTHGRRPGGRISEAAPGYASGTENRAGPLPEARLSGDCAVLRLSDPRYDLYGN